MSHVGATSENNAMTLSTDLPMSNTVPCRLGVTSQRTRRRDALG